MSADLTVGSPVGTPAPVGKPRVADIRSPDLVDMNPPAPETYERVGSFGDETGDATSRDAALRQVRAGPVPPA